MAFLIYCSAVVAVASVYAHPPFYRGRGPHDSNDKVLCPDQLSACFSGQECCPAASGFGCCPQDNACCGGGGGDGAAFQCCPRGYSCDSSLGRCVKEGRQPLPPATKHFLDLTKSDLVPGLPDASSSHQCPNGTQTCPDGESCCPKVGAVCCGDATCCSEDYTCCAAGCCFGRDGGPCCGLKCCTGNEICESHVCTVPGVLPLPALKLSVSVSSLQMERGVQSSAVCPDRVQEQCPEGNTCCSSTYNVSFYGCCPEPNAVCCGDKKHCCPAGFTCRPGKCLKRTELYHPMVDVTRLTATPLNC